MEAVWIGFAFALGLGVRSVGLPPLIGYLAAGFVITMLAEPFGFETNGNILKHVAHLGVLLLLFTVGLKLNVRSLFKAEVIGVGLIHFAVTVALFVPVVYLLLDVAWYTTLLIAIALGFSSTVLAAKVLEDKRELRAFHGRVAIGILIVQDLIALVVISVASGTLPSPWAFLVFGLPLLRPLLYKLMDHSGHEELLVLLGLLLAVVIGGYGFELVGLSSELGALVFGVLLSKHKRASELSQSLWSVKEVFLVGFFLQIGMDGLPDAQAWIFAGVMLVLLPLKAILFFFLLVAFKLRSRSAYLTSLSLGNYSEFGLIVASVLIPGWLIPLALTVSLSFIISAPLNRAAHPLYERVSDWLRRFERETKHPDEQPVDLGNADVLVLGMGRTGQAAYHELQRHFDVVGIDSDLNKCEEHRQRGWNVRFADAEDHGFWMRLRLQNVRAVVLCMSDDGLSKVMAAQQLRKVGFTGMIVSHSLHDDQAELIKNAGANETYLTMSEAGYGLAAHVKTHLQGDQVNVDMSSPGKLADS
ncbi:cation:proton antiporter [Aliidiomarina sp. Khilg15.8]